MKKSTIETQPKDEVTPVEDTLNPDVVPEPKEIVEENGVVVDETPAEIPTDVETTTLHLVDGSEIVNILPPQPIYGTCPECEGVGTILEGTKICPTCNGECKVQIN